MTFPVQNPHASPESGGGQNAHGFAFGTKGETLERLRPDVAGARFCDQAIVTVRRWRTDPAAVTSEVLDRFDGQDLAVRSSSTMEDGWKESGAGALVSVTGVSPVPAGLSDAINRVIESYGECLDSEQILIQPMVGSVALSGVVLTRDLDTGGPYYVIDYDDFSGRTDTVTGGAESKTVFLHRANPEALHSPRMRAIIDAVREIEDVTGHDRLDIEFCVTDDIEVFILQVRPLAASRRWQIVPDKILNDTIAQIRAKVADLQRPAPGVGGSTTILGEMPDWNPAEMIGNAPRRLAISLYQQLITDQVWSEARARMGYRKIDQPLMLDLAGRPYIDIRLSLNSFLPSGLDEALVDRVTEAQLAYLRENPDLHDKIEFDVAVTCRDVSFSDHARRLVEMGLSASDAGTLGHALRDITRRCMTDHRRTLTALLTPPRELLAFDTKEVSGSPLQRAALLLERTAMEGTLPFAMLARHAFIGVSFMRSFVQRGILDDADVERFMRSIRTIAGEVVAAMSAVSDGTMDEAAFLAHYGHLRPGTYDILSWRYDERPELYLGLGGRTPEMAEEFSLSAAQERELTRCLAEEGYDIAPSTLFDYISMSISAREEAKFAFTRGISDALVAFGEWGDSHGFARDSVSNLSVRDIFDGADDRDFLHDKIEDGREAHRLTRTIRLPHLIVEPDDLEVVRPLRGQPTFITNTSVTAPAKPLGSSDVVPLHGQIVLIKSADPGYDWIFSHDIRGLITEFGGVNSHMAIRCAEFGLPAAIGCGERLFGELLKSPVIELNCAARKVVGH